MGVHWKDWCWSWNSSPLATSCEELTHWKRPWCWERLKAGGEGDNRGWDAWMASLTRWTWVWINSRSWWWTGKPGMLQSMGSQSRTWLSGWTELNWHKFTSLAQTSPLICTSNIVMLKTELTCAPTVSYVLWKVNTRRVKDRNIKIKLLNYKKNM